MTPTGQYRYPKISEVQPGSFRRLLHLLFATATLLPLAILAWQWQLAPKSAPQNPASTSVSVERAAPISSSVAALASRPLYPYSVIPGGATDAQELKNALARDPVVAAHYTGFDTANAHVVRLDRARAVYVSYRVRNHIYWTSHTLALPKGEPVITDGEHLARTRCGNRMSDTPRTPVALVEPETAVLDGPEPEVALLPEPVGELPFPLAYPPVAPVGPGGGSIFIPPVVPILGGGGGNGGGEPNIPPKPPVPPLATPEPGTLLLVSTGFLGAWLTRKRSS